MPVTQTSHRASAQAVLANLRIHLVLNHDETPVPAKVGNLVRLSQRTEVSGRIVTTPTLNRTHLPPPPHRLLKSNSNVPRHHGFLTGHNPRSSQMCYFSDTPISHSLASPSPTFTCRTLVFSGFSSPHKDLPFLLPPRGSSSDPL